MFWSYLWPITKQLFFSRRRNSFLQLFSPKLITTRTQHYLKFGMELCARYAQALHRSTGCRLSCSSRKQVSSLHTPFNNLLRRQLLPTTIIAACFCTSTRQRHGRTIERDDHYLPDFRYKSLEPKGQPTTRLIELLPGSDQNPLECRLNEIVLSERHVYEALSYCWGDPKEKTTIICNDQQLLVPTNLADALNGLRYRKVSRFLWADAICINQSNSGEKASQVKLMRTIYSRGARTLIWLGDPNDRHEKGMSKFARSALRIGLFLIQRGVDVSKAPHIPVWDSRRNQSRVLLPYSGEFYMALVHMLRRPYFQRAWVVQEVVVSSRATLIWDHGEYEWTDVIAALKYMSTVHFPPSFLFSLQHIASIEDEKCRYKQGSTSLLGILLRHQRCEATDPRDKIYSFSGLVDCSDSKSVVPITYREDAAGIYQNLAIQILRETKNLDILSRPPTLQTSLLTGKVPSWVPDWSRSTSMNSSHTWSHGPLSLTGADDRATKDKPRFSTAGSTTYQLRIKYLDTLVVKGYTFDTVTETGEEFKGVSLPNTISSVPNFAKDWMNTLRSFMTARNFLINWQEMTGLRSAEEYRNGEPMNDAFWQTVSAGEIKDSEAVAASVKLWKRLTKYPHIRIKNVSSRWDFLGVPYGLFLLVWHMISNKPLLEFELQGRYTLNRRMIKTSNGYIGLASRMTEVGDFIVICEGSSVPLVLRKVEVEHRWRLIGDAYIHGIMAGEAFDGNKCMDMYIV
jgi:hypothetical protein